MAAKLLFSLEDLEKAKYQFGVFDHFDHYVTADTWTTVASDSGTVSVSDGVGGVLAIVPSDGSVADNDQSYVRSTTELFKFATGKRLVFEAKVQFTEANTDDANVAVGFANAVAADLIVDNGGMKTSGSMLAIYKQDGSNVWKCISSVSSSQTVTASVGNGVTATAGGPSYQTLRIEAAFHTSTYGEVRFFLDGLPLLDGNLKPIVHRFDWSTTPTEMHAFAGVKNGDSNLETLNVDYIGAYQGAL